ncbi:hypothetical protein BDN71DRAFT_1560307, partial [Pleurotus eryngii]
MTESKATSYSYASYSYASPERATQNSRPVSLVSTGTNNLWILWLLCTFQAWVRLVDRVANQSIATRQCQCSLTPKPDPGLLALASRQRRTFLMTRGDLGPGILLNIQAASTSSGGRSESPPIMDSQGNLVVHPIATGGEYPPQTDDANQQRIHSQTTSRGTDPVFLHPNTPSASGGSELPQNPQRSLAGETQASNNDPPAADGHNSMISPEVARSLGVAGDSNSGSGPTSQAIRLIGQILTTSFTAAHSLTTYAMSPKHKARVAEMTPGALDDLLDEIDIPPPGSQANHFPVALAANDWYSSFQMNMESNRDAMMGESLRDQDLEMGSQNDGYPGPEGNLQRDEEGRPQDDQKTQGGQRDDERAADGQRGAHGEGRAQDVQMGDEERAQGGQMGGEELPQDRWRDEEDRDRPRGGPAYQEQGAGPQAELYGRIQGLVDEMRADRQILVQQMSIGFERTADLIQQVLG